MQKEAPPPRSRFASLLVTVELEAKENYAAENLRALTFNPSGQEIKSLWFGKTFSGLLMRKYINKKMETLYFRKI